MINIQELEDLKKLNPRTKVSNLAQHLYRAYERAKDNEQEMLNLNSHLEILYPEEVEKLTWFLDRNQIKAFTISNTNSNLLEVLSELQRFGWGVNSIVTVKLYKNQIPAMMITKK